MGGLYGDSEIVSVRDGERTRATYAEVVARADRLAAALRGLGRPARRPRRHLHVELPRAPRGLLRRALHGCRAAHPEHPPLRRAAHLHRQPRRGPRRRRRRARSSPLLEELAPSFDDRRALRRRRRRRHRLGLPDALRLRGAPRGAEPTASTIPSSTTARPPASATRAAPPATPRASSTRTARTLCTRSGSAWPTRMGLSRARPRDAGRADVPRQRLGPALRRRASPAPTWSCPARTCSAEPLLALIDRRARDVLRRRCRRSGWTCCATPTSTSADLSLHADRDLRRLGRAAGADAGLRGAPRPARSSRPGA